MKIRIIVASAVVAIAGAALISARSPSETLVIEAAQVITGTEAPSIHDGAVVVAGNEITYVGSRVSRPNLDGARIIRAPHGTVLPGLIDSHVHFRHWMPRLFVEFGVTTVLDTGNQTDAILAARRERSASVTPGPRLFVVGLAISAAPEAARQDGREYVSTEEEARQAVRARLQLDIDGIKINGWFTAPMVRAVVEEARRFGKPVLGHLAVRADAAIEAGLLCLVHPYGLDLATSDDAHARAEIERLMPEYQARREYYPFHLMEPANYGPVIKLMVDRGAFFNPTFQSQFRGIIPEGPEFDAYDRTIMAELAPLFPELSKASEPLLPYYTQPQSHPISDGERKNLELGMANVARFMREFQQAGGKMVAGTDTSRIGIPGLRMHRELELWVRNGIPPVEALRAATQYSAQLLGKEDRLGTIAVGKLADLLIVNGDPLRDIRETKSILHVIKDGAVISRARSREANTSR